MAKYKKRDSNTWTLSSTALGWGAAAAVAVVVIVFGIGIYLGYGWGWEEGYALGEEEAMENQPDLAEQLAEFDRGDTEEFPLPEEEIPEELLDEKEQSEKEKTTAADEEAAEEEAGPDPYTEEELGLIDEPPTVTEEEPESDETTEEDKQKESEQTEQPEENRSREETEESSEQTEESAVTDETADKGDDSADDEELEIFYTVQAASSQKRENAERAREEYRGMGHSAAVREATINGQKWYRVRVGEFPTRRDARQYAEQMVEDGELNDYWISQVERE